MVGTGQNHFSTVTTEIISFGCNIFSPEELEDVQKAGIQDLRFCKLLEWICNEISVLYGLDMMLHAPTGPDNVEFFLLELSSLLSELECSMNEITCGPVMERFQSTENQTKLLNFLVGHMKCARLTALNRLREKAHEYNSDEVIYLKHAFSAVGLNHLPANITTKNIFSTLKNLVEKQMNKCKEKPHPLFTASLTGAQWGKIEAINKKLMLEYRTRILLLLKRLDVTIESFTWSDRIKKMQDELHGIYRPRREQIASISNVGMDDLLAVTSTLLTVDRINNEKERKRTASRLNKVLLTDHPGDRGGRPSELRAPEPEMPAWRKQRVSDQGMQRGDFKSGRGQGYQRGSGSGGYQGSGGFYDVYSGYNYQRGGGYHGGYDGRDFRSGVSGAGFESQVMREYEGYYNQSHSGQRGGGGGGGRRGRGGYGGQRGYR